MLFDILKRKEIEYKETGMKIIKHMTEDRRQYINVDTHILLNRSVGLDERGLLITLLNLPPGWEFSISGLCRLTRDGPTAIRSCLDRLVRHGYVWIIPRRNKKGRFSASELHVCEVPKERDISHLHTEHPPAEKP